jgi:flagellar biosynthesis/type III secretory pathway M-ring protein FliF/YscJ
MLLLLAILALFGIIFFTIRSFANRNWKLIYTTFGNEEYFKIIAKLSAKGIKYKVVTPQSGFEHPINRFKDQTQYDIYVKKEIEHLAYMALQESN